MRRAPPSLAFAAIGQARADGEITPEAESRTLSELLRFWALKDALKVADIPRRSRTKLMTGTQRLLQ
jgi:hypothetical protein